MSHVLLGNIYDKLERRNDAIQAYRRALIYNPYYMHGASCLAAC